MDNYPRGLRFKFGADAEVRVQDSLTILRGRVAISGSFGSKERLRVKIISSGEYVESQADVIYVRPSGIGISFVEVNPYFRGVLQKWLLSALHRQTEEISAK